jgi:hypothetical protein
MDLAEMTPVEIDTELYELYGKLTDLNTKRSRVHALVKMIEETEPGSYESKLPERSPKRHAELISEVAKLQGEADLLQYQEINPREDEWVRRGRWNRYYLVTNTNGHVHKDMDCPTCYFTTQYAWLVEQSGMSAEDLVEMAGEKACTTCFSWAPSDVLKRKTKLEAPEAKKARLEREAKKAAAAAKKAAKAIANPDGTPLAVFDWHVPEKRVVDRAGNVVKVHPAHDRFETIKTLHAARGWLTDHFEAWRGSDKRAEDVERVAVAIAVKEGKTWADVIEEAKQRAARRK